MGSTEVNKLTGTGLPPELAAATDALYSTAVPVSIIPAVTNAISLGSSTKAFATLFLQGPTVVPALGFEAVAAAGTNQGNAAALSATKFLHQVTAADGTKGVILPAVVAADVGKIHTIVSTAAAVLKVYPESGGTINGLSANAALSLISGPLSATFYVTAAATWIAG